MRVHLSDISPLEGVSPEIQSENYDPERVEICWAPCEILILICWCWLASKII